METLHYVYNNEKRFLKNLSIEKIKGKKYVSYSEILRADQRRIVENQNITIPQLFELLTLYAPASSRIDGIKQKFRFNKILFYIKKKLDEEYGKDVLEFDEIGKARAGPIPVSLREDICKLRDQNIVSVHIELDGKKIPKSDQNYDELMKSRAGSGVVELTPKGKKIAEDLWIKVDESFGDDVLEAITKTKQKLIYMDTEQLKEKVHSEYPEWRIYYTENDTENYFADDIC